MWSSAEISIVIEDVDHPTVLVRITTPIGAIDLLGEVAVVGKTLRIDQAHIGGLTANAVGRAGLNAIGRKLLEVADVAEIIIQGSTRTSGRLRGRIPRAIRFPRGPGD